MLNHMGIGRANRLVSSDTAQEHHSQIAAAAAATPLNLSLIL